MSAIPSPIPALPQDTRGWTMLLAWLNLLRNAASSLGQYITVTDIGGDSYLSINATFDGTNWNRTNTSEVAWLVVVNLANNMIGESYKAITLWNCQPGANPIGAFTSASGWLMVQSFSQYRDVTYGGFGFEVDGNGTIPYARVQHTIIGGTIHKTGLMTNAYLDESGRDNTTMPCWYFGTYDESSQTTDEFRVRRVAPNAGSVSWTDLLRLDHTGVMTLTGGITAGGNISTTGNVSAVNITASGALSGTYYPSQSTPINVNSTTTLTGAQLLVKVIYSTTITSTTFTLPTGANMDLAAPGLSNSSSFDVHILNSVSSSDPITIAANTNFSYTGAATINASISGAIRCVKTGTGTWAAYRII